MFSKNKNQKTSSGPSYIHTMKDDLINPYTNPLNDSSEPKTPTPAPFNMNSSAQQTSPVSPASETSPFLNNTPISTPAQTPTPQKPAVQPAPKVETSGVTPQMSVAKNTEAPKLPPFENSSSPKKTEIASKIPAPTNTSLPRPESEYTIEAVQTKHEGTKKFKLILFLIIVFVIAIVGAGGYFYWQINQPQTLPIEPTEIPAQQESEQAEESVTITPLNEKYSFTNPNILVFDIETITDAEIKEKFSQVTTEIKSMTPAPTKPVEFVIHDKNNTPLAFQRFATIAGIKLSSSLLASLDEKFSFYVFIDENNPRTGLSINIKDKAIALTEMLKEETSLVSAFGILFVPDQPTEAAIFKDGNYGSYSVRYANLSNQPNLSLDYSITTTSLLIGTSKNTLRAIIDFNNSVQMPDVTPVDPAQTSIPSAPITNITTPALPAAPPVDSLPNNPS